MNQIARCDWLPERSYLARSGLTAVSGKKFPRKPYNKSFNDLACSVKMVRYWPRSFFVSLWTSTPLRSKNMQKKRLLGQYPAILIAHLVNNPYVSHWRAEGGRKEAYICITLRVQLQWASVNLESLLIHGMAILSDLSRNRISQLPGRIFDKLKNLETL